MFFERETLSFYKNSRREYHSGSLRAAFFFFRVSFFQKSIDSLGICVIINKVERGFARSIKT